MNPSNSDVAEALKVLQRAILSHFGLHAVRIKISTRQGDKIQLPFPMCGDSAQAGKPADKHEESNDGDIPRRNSHSQCINDILATLERVKRPLTTTRLMSELSRAGKEWSLSHVAHFLAAMVQDGTLDNPKGVKPAGYRLPEWDEGEEDKGD